MRRALIPLVLCVACGSPGTGIDGDGGPGVDADPFRPDAQSQVPPDDLEVEPGCPGIYNPDQVLDYHLSMSSGDWQTVLADDTFSVYVPAQFACGDEVGITVGVRRKRSGGTEKVGLKIDINEFVVGQRYYGLRKLSLENGVSCCETIDGGEAYDYVAEYLAWRLMRLSGADSGRAAFANVFVNGDRVGVYVNVEHVDKTFLADRFGDDTGWLYKKSGGAGDGYKTHETDGLADPYADYFCFWGVGGGGGCQPPTAGELAAELPERLDIPQMLRMGAVNAFMANTDAPLGKDNNYYWYDWHGGGRIYLPWDLDSVMKQSVDPFASSQYTDVLFTNWRADYDAILTDLVESRLTVAVIHAELDRVAEVADAAFAADPYIGGGVTGAVDDLKSYWSSRHAEVSALLP